MRNARHRFKEVASVERIMNRRLLRFSSSAAIVHVMNTPLQKNSLSHAFYFSLRSRGLIFAL
jgi:hypothetical protein